MAFGFKPTAELEQAIVKPATKPVFRHTGRGLLACLLAKPGMGKSSLLAQIPRIKFITDFRDQGILDLMEYSATTGVRLKPEQVQVCSTYDDLDSALEQALNEDFPSYAVESIVGIQSLCEDKCLKVEYGGNSALYQAYRNGKDSAANVYYQKICDRMIMLQNRGKNVWHTGHARTGTGKAISGDDWVSQVLESLPEIGRRVDATFQLILHIGSTVATVKPAGKVRATGMDTKMYVDVNPHFPAKNRMGLVDPIDYPASPQEAYRAVCAALKFNPITFRRES